MISFCLPKSSVLSAEDASGKWKNRWEIFLLMGEGDAVGLYFDCSVLRFFFLSKPASQLSLVKQLPEQV